MADIKATSFRINEEDIAKFKEFAEQEGYNQAEAFNSMIQTLEMARAKGMIKDRAKEIEVFQNTVNSLISMFLNSLNINQLSEERIREELSLELNNKDNTISMAFEQMEELRIDNDRLNASNKDLNTSNKEFDEEVRKLNSEIIDKQKNIDKLNSNNDLLQEQLQEYKQYKTNHHNVLNELEQVKVEKEEIAMNNNKLTNDNELLNSKLQSNADMLKFYKEEIDIKNTSINELKADNKSLEHKHSNYVQELNEQHNREIEVLNQQYDKKVDELKEIHEKTLQDNINNITNKHEVELSKKDLEIETFKNKIKDLEKLQAQKEDIKIE